MTYCIVATDEINNAMGGAVATGGPCVGGYVPEMNSYYSLLSAGTTQESACTGATWRIALHSPRRNPETLPEPGTEERRRRSSGEAALRLPHEHPHHPGTGTAWPRGRRSA